MINQHEYGLSRGMIYPDNGPGLPWPGLVKVSPKLKHNMYPIYDNGKKYDVVGIPEATGIDVTALTLPTYVAEVVGFSMDSSGIMYDEQELGMFSLAYRTETENNGHKLVVQFNIMASLNDATSQTLEETVTPSEFTISGESVPETLGPRQRASRIELSTRNTDRELLAAFDDALRTGSMSEIAKALADNPDTVGRINALRSI